MNTKSSTNEVFLIVLMLLPFVYLGLIWTQLPATIPGHYGANGKPDRYDPKEQLALAMGALTVFLYLVFRFVPRLDPRENLNSALYQKIRSVVFIFWAAFLVWFWTISWKGVEPKTLGVSTLVGVGLLIACLGNLMHSVKPNYFVGIRTPWTLESETVWRKTHHLGSRVMVVGGVLSAAAALFIPMPYTIGVVLGLIGISILVPVVYSYIYYRQEKFRQSIS